MIYQQHQQNKIRFTLQFAISLTAVRGYRYISYGFSDLIRTLKSAADSVVLDSERSGKCIGGAFRRFLHRTNK